MGLLSNDCGRGHLGIKSRSPALGGRRCFRILIFKVLPLNFLNGRDYDSSCHLISTPLALTCVRLFNNSSFSGTSWSP